MNKILRFAFLAFLLLPSKLDAFAGSGGNYWSRHSFEIALSKKLGFDLKPEFRFQDTKYYYFKSYLGLSYKINKFIRIRGYYAYKTKKEKEGWKSSDLLYLDPSLKFNLPNFNLSNRLRLEYNLDKEELICRYRLKLGKNLHKLITFALKEEIFYSFLSDRSEENRLSLGPSVEVLNKISFSAEYMLRSKRAHPRWKTIGILITSMGFVF